MTEPQRKTLERLASAREYHGWVVRGAFNENTLRACLRRGWIEQPVYDLRGVRITEAGRKALEEGRVTGRAANGGAA